jgi:hypothetical protein
MPESDPSMRWSKERPTLDQIIVIENLVGDRCHGLVPPGFPMDPK